VEMTGKVATTAVTPIMLINACSALGTVTYLGASNFNFNFDHMLLTTAASQPDTTFTVDTDTGWLAGDVICISGTNKTSPEAGLFLLNANAGGSSFTSALSTAQIQLAFTSLNFTYSGTAPIQADIGLLTRNVKIRSTSVTFMSFVYCAALATVTASWAEFSRLGASTGRRGIEFDIGAVANPKTFSYCSLYSFDVNGFYLTAAAAVSVNANISNCVTWFIGNAFNILGPIANNDWTFDNNLIMRSFALPVSLIDIGGTFTNNIICNSTSGVAMSLVEANGVLGTFNNNLIHTCSSVGLQLSADGMIGTLNNLTVWRCSGAGVSVANNIFDFLFTNLTLFGNTATNFSVSAGNALVTNAVLAGDVSFPTTNGFLFPTGTTAGVVLNNVDMSGTATGMVPHSAGDLVFTSLADAHIQTNNCKFGVSPPFIRTNLATPSVIGFEKFNQTAGDHRCEMKWGQNKNDVTLYRALAPSMRMTPNSLTNKLESAPKTYGVRIPVNNGEVVSPAVWIKKSGTIDSANYNGSQPRLIQRANAALGQNTDLVLATATDTPTSVMGIAVWDSLSSPLITLSNGSLTSTNTGTTQLEQGCKPHISAAQNSGRYYIEVSSGVLPFIGIAHSLGIGQSTATITQVSNNAINGAIVRFGDGFVYVNNVLMMGFGAVSIPYTYAMAVDLDTKKVWFRVYQSGAWSNWNSSSLNAPGGAGGYDFSMFAGPYLPFLGQGGANGAVGNVYNTNFGASAFIGPVPAGYGSWPGPTFTSAWTQLTGTSSVATDDGVWEFVIDCDGNLGWLNIDDWTFVGAATTANGMKNWYQGMPVIGGGGGAGGGYFSGGFV
jgi:hypothetical protein